LSLWVNAYSLRSIKWAQAEVDTLLSYRFGEERFWRHDPKKVVKDYSSQIKDTWEYTLTNWEEEEVHCGAKMYDEFIVKRNGRPIGRIVDEEKSHEEAKRKEEEEVASKMSVQLHLHILNQPRRRNQQLTRKEGRKKGSKRRRRALLRRRERSKKLRKK
jgi:hypothetical protein